MSKMIIPEQGLWRTFRNCLEIDPLWRQNHNNNPVMTIFTNDKNHHILNIPNKVNSITNKQTDFLRILNVHGTFEINSPCDVNLYCFEHKDCDFSEPMWNRNDRFCCNELIINLPRERKGKPTILVMEIHSSSLKPEDQTLEKISFSAGKVITVLSDLKKLKELNVDADEFATYHGFYCPNLKRFNLKNIKNFNLGETYSRAGFNIFDSNNVYNNNESISRQILPDNCILNLPLNCKLYATQNFSSRCNNLEKELKINGIEFKDFINESKANSFTNKGDGTFDIQFCEFKSLVEEQLINSLDQHVQNIKNNWKTQNKIIKSMIQKPEIKKNIKKI